MTIPLWCLLGFVAWTLVLVVWLSAARLRHMARGGSHRDFGIPDDRKLIWRLFRAHLNALENLPLFASVVLVAAVRGVTGRALDALAVVYLAARIGQSLVHAAPGAGLAFHQRFVLLIVQLLCLIGLIVLAAGPVSAEPFEKVWCLRYAAVEDAPLSGLLAGAPAGETTDLPFAMCAARAKQRVIVMDAGFVNQELGKSFGVRDFVEYKDLLGEVGIRPEEVELVTLSHLHFDHAGGTSRFPKAKFVVQKRELEFAAALMPHNSAARQAFVAEDVLSVVKLNWEGRVLLVDGDAEGLVPGLDVYLTPGHTAGTMTACLDTVKGRVCYSSDAVYLYRNLEEDIPLGLAIDPYEAVESYKKIRKILRGGTLIPGHEPRIFETPEAFGFRRVSKHAVAVVE